MTERDNFLDCVSCPLRYTTCRESFRETRARVPCCRCCCRVASSPFCSAVAARQVSGCGPASAAEEAAAAASAAAASAAAGDVAVDRSGGGGGGDGSGGGGGMRSIRSNHPSE